MVEGKECVVIYLIIGFLMAFVTVYASLRARSLLTRLEALLETSRLFLIVGWIIMAAIFVGAGIIDLSK